MSRALTASSKGARESGTGLRRGRREGRTHHPTPKRGDAQCRAASAAASRHLERLQQLVEVAHLDRTVMAQQCGERPRGADDRARVGQRGPCSCLGAPDLEADDGLAGVGRAGQRGGERVWPADRLDEQADGARALVLRQVRDEIGDVARGLASGGDDGAKPDPGPASQERLSDGPRVGDAGDMPGHERVRASHRAEPQGDAARRRDAHAVGPDDSHVVLGRRAPTRSATARPSAPASAPSPGSTTARTPAAIASSKALSARAWPTSRYAHSGCSGSAVSEAKHSVRARSAGWDSRTTSARPRPAPAGGPRRSRRCGRSHLPLRRSAGRAVGGCRRAERRRSRDERTEPGLRLGGLQPAVVAAQLLGEAAGLRCHGASSHINPLHKYCFRAGMPR